MNGAIMKSLFKTTVIALLLIVASSLAAKAQDSRIQLGSLDHLAAKASQNVDVNVDERLMKLAARLFNDKDEDERDAKKLIEGLKGIYVKSFEFETEGQFVVADLEPIRTQLRGAGWTKMVNITSKREGNVEVYIQFAGETVNGLAVLVTDVKEVTVVNIVGPVDLDKLAQLEGNLGVPELGIESSKTKKKSNEQ